MTSSKDTSTEAVAWCPLKNVYFVSCLFIFFLLYQSNIKAAVKRKKAVACL